MEAMSIDMDITGNTATSLGTWDECTVTSPGSTITIDVTAAGIPEAYPMGAFGYTLNYPAGRFAVQSADANFLLGSAPGSSVIDVSALTPDTDGVWAAGAADVSVATHESGSGVLQRLTLSISPAAPANVYGLILTYAGHIDENAGQHAPNTINNAFVAVNTTCENLPTPTPTPSPMPPAPNDNFADAVVIEQLPYLDVVSTAEATIQPGEVSPCGSIGATVWYAFTPSEATVLQAHTAYSEFDTVLAAYTGEGLAELNLLGCSVLGEYLRLEVGAGQTVYFQAGGSRGTTGSLAFALDATPTPTATPTPPPLGTLAGDVDCNGAITAVDSLRIALFEVGLPANVPPGCPDLGTGSLGDVDCDGYTNLRDALGIVRYVAGLTPPPSTPGCPAIGEPTSGGPYPVPSGGAPTPGPNGFAVSVTSAVIPAGEIGGVLVQLSAPEPGMGAFSLSLAFDPAQVTVTDCWFPSPVMGACNPDFAPGTIRIAGVVLFGETGVDLASIQFRAGDSIGVSDLTPQVSMLLDSNGDPRTATAIPGSLTILSASTTPTPTPNPGGGIFVDTPTPTRSATATPAASPTPTPRPSPTPTAAPLPAPPAPIELDVDIDDDGRVSRTGAASVYGWLECSVPSLVDLTIEMRQRSGSSHAEGAAEISLWCDGRERWRAKVEPEGRDFKPGHATVSVHAVAQAGQQTAEDDESQRVHLESRRHKEWGCRLGWGALSARSRCRD
jgi:hypothetical protein